MRFGKTPSPPFKRGSLKIRRSHSSFIFSILITMVLVFVLFLFVYEVANNRAEVKRSSESLAIAQEELRRYTIENEQLRRYAQGENLDDYLDRFARDEMGYADPQERVYRIEPEK